MATFQSPGTKITQVRKGPVSLPGLSTAIGGFLGLFEKGPLNEPVLVTGIPDAQEVFGDSTLTTYQKTWDALLGFFGNGGESCYLVRVLGEGPVAASRTLQAGDAASAGSLTSGAAFPVALVPGDTFTGKVDGGGAVTITIAATRAMYDGTIATYAAVTASHVLVVTINGTDQTITFAGTENTQALFLTTLNGQLQGAAAINVGGQIRLQTDKRGSGASGVISNTSDADVLASLGFTASASFTNAGPNNVADVGAVTAAEFAGLATAAYVGSTTVAVGSTAVTWTSGTTGGASSVQFSAGTGVAKVTGFDNAVHSGSASSLTSTITVTASSEGAWGNNGAKTKVTQVDTVVAKAPTIAAGSTTTLTLSAVGKLAVGDTISITKVADTQRGVITLISGLTVTLAAAITVPGGGYDGTQDVVLETFNLAVYDKRDALYRTFTNLRMSSLSVSNYFVTVINNASRTPITVADLAPVVDDPRPVTDTSITVMTSGSDGAAITDADYIGSTVGPTGFDSFSAANDVNFISCPGTHGTDGAILLGLQAYCENRADVQAVYDFPLGLTPTTVKTYVQLTANLAGSYEGGWWPNVKKIDEVTGVKRVAYSSGYMQGVIARTHRTRNFGKAPAGIVVGQIQGIVGLEYDLKEGPDYDIIYPANINGILNFPGQGYASFGSRTFDPTGEYGQWNVQTVFNVVKRAVDEGTRFAAFEPNDADLWASITRVVSVYLRGLRLQRILQGATDEEAFFVICDSTINTPLVTESGKVKCRIGLAVTKPAEFLDFEIEQNTAAIDAALAG
jgi:phage tail sheath protein FI